LDSIREKLTEPTERRYIVALSLLLLMTSGVGFLATDIYAPALPAIVSYFGTNESTIKLTITVYILAFTVSQLFYGPLSDAFGRKPVLMLGMSIGFVGTILAAVSTNVTLFFIGRAIQGVGFAATNGLVRTITKDSFHGPLFLRILSILSAALCLGFVFGPLIGAYIASDLGWRSTFYFVLAYLFIMMVLQIVLLPETHKDPHKDNIRFRTILKNYKRIIRNRIFFANAFSGGAAITGIITFYIVTPFMLQDHFGLSMMLYGWITLGFSLALVFGITIGNYLVKYIRVQNVVSMGVCGMVLGSLIGAIFGFEERLSIFSVIFPFSIYALGTGLAFSNSLACAFKPFKHSIGSAGAAYVFIRMGIGFLGTLVAAWVDARSLLAVSTALICFSGITFIVYFSLLYWERSNDCCS
jgi:DHA1 family 2-module integral membrane pump EmrD-like MFS transporter